LAFELIAAILLVVANGFFVATEFAVARLRLVRSPVAGLQVRSLGSPDGRGGP